MTTASWSEDGTRRTALWRAENGGSVPARIVAVDDQISASAALRLARSGSGLLWRGDFHNARQLMRAMDRRIVQRPSRAPRDAQPADVFRAHRKARSERAALLGKILIALESDYSIRLRRAPDVCAACRHAYGPPVHAPTDDGPGAASLVSLPELLGVIGAYEWHRKGIEVAALGTRIYPAYGVFAPTRDEYVDLVAGAAFPRRVDPPVVFDIGTGTGVLAALLAQRGAREVVATDLNPRAVQCARENVQHLGLVDRVRIAEADLWPGNQRADLIVCNPPWLPGHPTSTLELGIYDPASTVLNRFLTELPDHLTPQGEGWLILSDLAEHLGLRTRDELLARIADAGLAVAGTHETAPRHSRITDSTDPLHAARARERTVLWRLTPRLPRMP
ncbi:methyltransferase [Phytoactinopolyspora limicola]|uniref:methyltransferase n=1 Tax=Phytoactinopolyspora limicola TaxID=2715536 RepID=UPI001407509D|nr:class I SAM-dependent methyltransferase [Phytoactinopolyspora limicola]